MYLINLRRYVITALHLISLSIFTISYFSEAGATEFSKISPVNSVNNSANKLNTVIQEHSANINVQKRNSLSNPILMHKETRKPSAGWNSNLQPYIDAHRKFWTS